MFYVINIALFVICAMFLTVLVFLLFRAERRLAKYGESILFKSVKKELIKEEVSEEERNDEKEETFYKGYDKGYNDAMEIALETFNSFRGED